MTFDFKGKTALVTGATSNRGIGFAIAMNLARGGADIAVADIHARHPRSAEEDKIEGWKGLDSVVEAVEDLGCRGLAIVADVTKSDQVKEMVDKTVSKFGRIDILVNNAGIFPTGSSTLKSSEETWWEVLGVNLIGPFLCAKEAARGMVEGGKGGKIINIASVAGKIGQIRYASYSASKAALINLTQTLALELAQNKINVNAICPGGTATELASGIVIRGEARKSNISIEDATAKAYSRQIGMIPLGRVAQPDDQAKAVAFLASNEADHITGIALNVNGGILMAP